MTVKKWIKYNFNDIFWFQEGPGVRNWQFTTEGIKLLNVANITNEGNIDLSKTDRCLSIEEIENKYKHFLVDQGDLVIASSGISFDVDGLLRTRGAFVAKKHLPLCMNTSTIRFKLKDNKSDLLFLKFWLDSFEFRDQITRFVTGSAQQNFGPSHLNQLTITLPPLEEQKRIAEILSKCDNIRHIRKYSLQVSDTYLQSVFLEMFGDFNHNSKKWDYQSFDDVCAIDAEMVNPKEKPYCNYLHIGGANIESVTGNLLDLKTAKEDGLISSKFLINEEHLIFSKIRPKLRKISYPKIKALCSADIYPIRIRDKDKSNIYYLLFYLKSEFFSKIVSELAESRTNIPKVNREELAEQFIPIPPLSLQEKFAKIVKKFESYRNQQQEAQRQANHLFQTLLHQAFTGKL